MAVKSFKEIAESSGDIRHTGCRNTNVNSSKHVTPFSIDDILSRRDASNPKAGLGPIQPDNLSEALLSATTSVFPSSEFLPWTTGIYPKWFENLHRLYTTASTLQPFLLPVTLPRPNATNQLAAAWYAHTSRLQAVNTHPNDEYDPWIPKRRKVSLDVDRARSVRRKSCPSPRISDTAHIHRCGDALKNGASSMDDSGSDTDEYQHPTNRNIADKQGDSSDSPIHALEKLACSTFKGMEEKQSMLHSIAIGRQVRVKRRKCRTAFTSFQLSVLEQRFSCHKYLTPADRDQIAQALGLTAPQMIRLLRSSFLTTYEYLKKHLRKLIVAIVITWFQNRRAKLKRDMEEMRNDLKTVNPYTEGEEPVSEASGQIVGAVGSSSTS